MWTTSEIIYAAFGIAIGAWFAYGLTRIAVFFLFSVLGVTIHALGLFLFALARVVSAFELLYGYLRGRQLDSNR